MKVAALISCYNKEEKIVEALSACLACNDIDIIHVYDDCSTDGSVNLLSKFAVFDKVIISVGEVNRGVSYVRNYLFENTEADIYVLLDGDDVIIPSVKSEQINEMKLNNRLVFSYSDYYRTQKNFIHMVRAGGFTYSRLEMYNFIPFSSVIVRKKLHFEKIHHEDYLCWLFDLKDVSDANVHHFAKPTFYYHTDNNSLSANVLTGFLATYVVKRRTKISHRKILAGTILYITQALRKRFPTRKMEHETKI